MQANCPQPDYGSHLIMKRASLLLLACLTAACSTPIPPAPPPPPPAPQAAAPEPAPVVVIESESVTVATPSPKDAFEQMRAAIDGDSVYFDFNQYAIKPDQTSAVSEHAKLANDFASDYIILQGNCDERGSREYNLALGQKRADAVKRTLVLMGVPERRIETISFGKEKPRALCHDETCWSDNRRADFVDAWKALTETSDSR
jgi:peptidoglycan-associated lipoprotein